MDVMALAGMVFVLIIIGMVGGFILLFPITRRLGAFLEQRLRAGSVGEASNADFLRLEASVRGIQEELERIAERQTFTDSLLGQRERIQLPEGTETHRIGPTA